MPLPVGAVAPDFTLTDPMTGRSVSLSDYAGSDRMLVFFRGTWCPYCRDQMHLLAENQGRLAAAGIALLGVVCQASASVRRYLDAHPLPFPLLPDETRNVARSYGVHYWVSYEGINLAQPSLFIVDRAGIVTFAHRGRNMRDLPVSAVIEKFIGFLGDGTPSPPEKQ
jgi:peroxiredoxin Q/BCP